MHIPEKQGRVSSLNETMIAEAFSIGSLLKRWRAQRDLSQL